MNTMEENRLKVLEMSLECKNLYNDILEHNKNFDMWLCFIIVKDAFGQYQIYSAYFSNRYQAEMWFTNNTDNVTPFYGYCCEKTRMNKIDELLK